MKKFIKTYRGARIFDATNVDKEMGKPLGRKMVAKAILPQGSNLGVDFIEEADTREKAISRLEDDIDKYLEEHKFDSFKSSEDNH